MAAAEKQSFTVIKKSDGNHESLDALKSIEASIRTIKFGTVTVHVEDGKVIQVDTLEKKRFH